MYIMVSKVIYQKAVGKTISAVSMAVIPSAGLLDSSKPQSHVPCVELG